MENLYLYIFIGTFLIFLGIIFRSISKRSASSKSDLKDYEVLEIQLNKNLKDLTDKRFSSLASESMFAALHGLLKEDERLQEHLSFEIVSSGYGGIRFYVIVPTSILRFVESQIYAQHPNCQIKVVEDYTPAVAKNGNSYQMASVKLGKEDFFPIKNYLELEVDPISSVTSAISTLSGEENIWYQVVVKPIPDKWQKDGFDYIKAVRDGENPSEKISFKKNFFNIVVQESIEMIGNIATGLFRNPNPDEKKIIVDKKVVRTNPTLENQLRFIEDKLSKMGFTVDIRVLSSGSDKERVELNLRSVLASLSQFSTTSCNTLVSEIEDSKEKMFEEYVNRVSGSSNKFILNTQELGTIFHFPTSSIDTPNISWVYSKKTEPPSNLPIDDCCYIGKTLFRNKTLKFGIKNNDDRLRHLYVIGKSGTGKSTLFEQMVSQDIANGFGVGVLDPHGETIERVLHRIPDNRVEDVIYFDPSDTENPLGLNLMEIDDPSQKNLMASGLVSAIKQHFDFSWGPRLEYLLNYCILTLLEVPGTTMLGITRLLEDNNYLQYILHDVKDPVVQKFWNTEFKAMKGNQKLVTEAIAPIQNKVNRFLASTTIRNILGQRNSTVDLWDAMNSGKIIFMNLSKGKIGSDNANLLGALLVSRLQFYALQRVKIPYDERRPFYLYVDEFQNFATGSFEEILSESRKYKLGLYLTHQFTAQLPEELLDAVYGNVGTTMSFALGAPDANDFAREFSPYYDEEDLISLERFQVYIKLMIDGMTSHPFSARIMVPWEEDGLIVPKTENFDRVIAQSREKYGSDRQRVEDKVGKWLETRFDKGMAVGQSYSNNSSI